MPTATDDLIGRLERLAVKYEANHLLDHARGVRHALREVRAFFAPVGLRKPVPEPYPPNVKCACGELIHPDMPNVWPEADGVLWHANENGGGHRADVQPI